MTNNRKKIANLTSEKNQEEKTIRKARASWQMFTIMAEFIEATEHLSEIGPAVSIYGSARLTQNSTYYSQAEKIAQHFSEAGFAVITGGGPGIMEAANKGAQKGEGHSIGLNIELPHEQKGNEYQDVSLKFRHFFTRKVTFVKNSAASIILPGGFGTLDELSEVLTLIQTGKSRKMPVILVDKAFWTGLIEWFENKLLTMGLISQDDLKLIQIIDEPQAVVQAVLDFYEDKTDEPQDSPQSPDDRMFYL